MAKAKPRLGKGLAGLLSGNPSKATAGAQVPASADQAKKATARSAATVPAPDFLELPVSKLEPNPFQPRREFDESQLKDLAESIRSEGLIQPVVVREVDGRFQLVAGERRWRAFQLLNQAKIPARVVKAGDASTASMALIENLQRENLNPIEESLGFASLLRDFDLTQEQVAERVGKGRATIANALRLLTLPDEVRGYLSSGLISTGHAKVLLGLPTTQEQLLVSRRVIEEGASVRATESLVDSLKRSGRGQRSPGRSMSPAEAAAIEDIEKRMTSYLNANVALKHTPKKGRILIEYSGNEDLQRILERIGLEES